MHASLRALVTGIIDYAGLFPPARLPLDEAVRNYLRFQTEPEGWMLGRFVCPAARLEEIKRLIEPGGQFPISCLGQGGNRPDDFLSGVAADMDLVRSFRADGAAEVAVYETRLPPHLFQAETDRATVSAILSDSASIIAAVGMTPFFELPLDQNWRPSTLLVAETLAGLKTDRQRWPGVKIRCGGLEAKDFPAVEQLAGVIHACREHCVPFKATAGLHHPLRHHDPVLGAAMHGFLNVFGAAALAHANRLGESELRAIIADEDSGHFVFDKECFRWKSHRAFPAQLGEARRGLATSFGSCSFDEPRGDLRTLGLLPPPV